MQEPLTKRQRQIFDFISEYIEKNSYAPSMEEIKVQFDLKAISTVHEHLLNLRKKGYITREVNQSRGINLADQSDYTKECIRIPLVGIISASSPINYLSKYEQIYLNSSMFPPRKKFFAVKVKDMSFEDEHIVKGDILIIEDTENIENGCYIILSANGSNKIMIKRYFKEKYSIKLESDNKILKARTYKSVSIKGVLRKIIRDIV